jgi:dolichol-phosphate mannosyltransferase
VLANGQCFVSRRDLLVQHGGYAPAKGSFCDDVTLARHLAAHGARVGFLDGSKIIQVSAYSSLSEMWREWGRSFDLKDATPLWRRWLDVALVWAIQALPFPFLLAAGVLALMGMVPDAGGRSAMLWQGLLLVNGSALFVRLFMLWALRGSYAERGWSFWLSWLSDLAAAWRLTLSTAKVPKAWRGRQYELAR